MTEYPQVTRLPVMAAPCAECPLTPGSPDQAALHAQHVQHFEEDGGYPVCSAALAQDRMACCAPFFGYLQTVVPGLMQRPDLIEWVRLEEEPQDGDHAS